MSDLTGQNLGQYQIVGQIGLGGMATVYKAYQASMDRFVAVKVLPRQLAEDPSFIGRFEQEARTIANLENKNILPVYDYGEHDGHTYLVMRYVGHGTLKDLTQQGPLALPDAVEYFSQIAEALQYAHERGVIHRDVKTSNVLIDADHQCYLTDFGIAKLAAGSSHFTASGAIVGTPAYMSPEQCSGIPADARSDIYALGIVLYEMLTGAVPFEAETPVAVVLMHVQTPLPSPRKINPNIPEPVEQVVFRALAKQPAARYQSAADFDTALRTAFSDVTDQRTASMAVPQTPSPADLATIPPPSAPDTRSGAPTTPQAVPPAPAPPSRRPWWHYAAGLAALLAVILIIALVVRPEDSGDDKLAAVPTATPTDMPTNTPEPTPTLTDVPTNTPEPPPTPTDVPPHTPEPTATATVPPPPADQGWAVYTTTRGYGDGERQLAVHPVTGVWMASGGGLVHVAPNGVRTVYTSADGLAFNDIGTLAFDYAGDLWLTSNDGVPGVMRITFDGDGAMDRIEHYTRDNSRLRAEHVYALFPLRDGTMLVGTDYTSYIEMWTGDHWDIPDFPTLDTSLEDVGEGVRQLMVSRTGTVWAMGPRGLAVFVEGADDWRIVPPPAALANDHEGLIYGWLYPDRLDDAIWIGLYAEPEWQQSIWRLVRDERDGRIEWQAAADVYPDLPEDLHKVYREQDGALWLVGYDRLVMVDPDGRPQLFTYDNGIVGDEYYDLVQDNTGAIWLSTDVALMHYDGRRWGTIMDEEAVPFHNAVAMAQDQRGYWFLSPYGGLALLAGERWEMLAALDLEAYDMVLYGEELWIATEHGIVHMAEQEITHITTAEGLTHDTVYTLVIDPGNHALLWAGTDDGLNLINMDNLNILTWTYANGDLPGPVVSLIYADYRTDEVWIGTGGHYDNAADKLVGEAALLKVTDLRNAGEWEVAAAQNDPLDQDDWFITSLAVTDDGDLWLGTNVRVYRRQDERWQRFTDVQGAPEWAEIRGIVVLGDTVWVGTNYYGLYLYDARGWYRLGHEGIGGNHILALFPARDGALWILTESGITRLKGNPLEFAQ